MAERLDGLIESSPFHKASRKMARILVLTLLISIFSPLNVNKSEAVLPACSLENFVSDVATNTQIVKFFSTVTCSSTWTVPMGVSNVEVLLVAGGGGSGLGTWSGAGGAGGVLKQDSFLVTTGSVVSVQVGGGGLAGGGVATNGVVGCKPGGSGGNSNFGSLAAIGGGGGGPDNQMTGCNNPSTFQSGTAGGSGGGVGENSKNAVSTSQASSTQTSPGLGSLGGAHFFCNYSVGGDQAGSGGGGASANGGYVNSSNVGCVTGTSTAIGNAPSQNTRYGKPGLGGAGTGLYSSFLATANSQGTSFGQLSSGTYYVSGGGTGSGRSTNGCNSTCTAADFAAVVGGGGKGLDSSGVYGGVGSGVNLTGGGGGGGGGNGGSGFVLISYISTVIAPTYTSLSPTSGTTAGGTSVTITGTNLSSATSVTVGGSTATISSNSATAITITTPSGSAGAKDVVITTAGGSVTAGSAFTYVVPAPTYTLLSPTSGTTAGGTSVTIVGTNLSSATSVTVGGGTAIINSNSATAITITTPSGSAGVKDVVITTAGGSVTAGSAFTYLSPGLTPVFDTPTRTSGGFSVSITNFDATYTWTNLTVSAGSVAVTSTEGTTRVITVTGLTSGQSATVTQVTSKTGFTNASANVSGTALTTQSITWSPTTSLLTTDSPATPSTLASSLGSVSISYSLVNAGTTGCTIDSSTAVITFNAPGSCVVRASTNATATYTAGNTDVTFVISQATRLITVTQTSNGSISPTTTTLNYGADQVFTFTPNTGYSVATITVDGSLLSSASLEAAIATGYAFTNVTSARSITATYSANSYSITYKAGTNGSGSDLTQNFTFGSNPTLKDATAALARTGYAIAGWSTTDGSSQTHALNASYSSAANLILYPVWSANSYTITYKAGTNGSGADLTQSFSFGSNPTLKDTTAALTRTGYAIAGWSTTDGAAQTHALSASYLTADNLILYPVWSVNTYSITYKAGTNGTGTDLTQSFTYGASATLKDATAALIRAGYAIAGWSTTDGAVQTHALNASYSSAANLILYPVWGANTYSITYKAGTNGSGADLTQSFTFGSNPALKDATAALTRTGYAIAGWSTTDGSAQTHALSASYLTASDVILYPVWSANTYTITFDANGTTGGTTPSVAYGANALSSAPGLNRSDYSLAGWSETTSGSVLASWSVTGTKTLYAIWTPAFVVTFVSDGSPVASLTYTTTALAKPTDPTKTGYGFTTWKDASNNTISWPYTPTTSITLTAYWLINSYVITITQSANGSISPTSATLEHGASQLFTFTPATGYSVATITIDGSALSGSALTTAITSGYTFTSISAAHSVGATYVIISYVITYKAGTNGTGTDLTQIFTYGATASLKDATAALTRTGYSITGWSTTDASAQTHALNASYSTNADLILYPVWNINTYRVTFDSPKATVTELIVDYIYASPALTLPSRTRANYVLQGWYSAATGGTKIGIATASYTPTASITLYAQWVQETLNGIEASKLTFAGDIRASATQARTLVAETTSSSVSVRVPAGALPEGTFVEVYSLSTDEYSRGPVGIQGDYIVNLIVAWHTIDELVPVATTPIIMTVRNATIKQGADVYAIQGSVVKKLATATADGEVVILISEDPIITITNPVVSTSGGGSSGGGGAPSGGGGAPSGGGGAPSGGGVVAAVSTPKTTAINLQLVDPLEPTKAYNKSACVDIYTRTTNPQLLGSACSTPDGQVSISVVDSKISLRVYNVGSGSIYREYDGVVQNDVVTIEYSKYFPGTSRWIVNVSTVDSITSPAIDIKNVEDAQTQANKIIEEAKKQAAQILEEAKSEIKTVTETETAKILDAATATAAKILEDANAQAAKVLAELKAAAATPKPTLKPSPTPTPKAPVATPKPTPTPVKAVPKTLTISCKKGSLVKSVTSTTPKCPSGYTQIKKASASPSPIKVVEKLVTITCVKGALSRKVTGLKPVCPTGFRKRLN